MSLEFFFNFFNKYHIHSCFFYRSGQHLYIILKENYNENYIIFLNYLIGMKIVVPENFDFQY